MKEALFGLARLSALAKSRIKRQSAEGMGTTAAPRSASRARFKKLRGIRK